MIYLSWEPERRKNLETWLDQRYAGKCLTTGSPGFKKKKKKEAPFVC